MIDDQKIKDEVWQTVVAMNRAWTLERNTDRLIEFFHRDMVAVTPSDLLRLEGRDACIAGWKRFTDAAKILWWKETDPRITLFAEGKTAVVTYYWDIEYELGGRHVHTNGRDMFMLVNEGGRWWAVADQFSLVPAKE